MDESGVWAESSGLRILKPMEPCDGQRNYRVPAMMRVYNSLRAFLLLLLPLLVATAHLFPAVDSDA